MAAVHRVFPILALAAGCGVVIVDPHDAGWHPDAEPEIDGGDPIDSGTEEDATPEDASDSGEIDTGVPDAGLTQILTIHLIGPGRVTSTPAGIDCPGTCEAPFLYSAPLELRAEPDRNARRVAWSAPCTDAAETCSIALTRDLTVVAEFEERPPIVTTGQGADLVLGQPDFTSTDSVGVTGSTLRFPLQCATAGSRLWISDSQNNRVLQWDAEPFLNGQSANFALGQPNLVSVQQGFSQSRFNAYDVASDGSRVFAVGGNRVLVFDPIPTSFLPEAALVFGQPDFLTSNTGLSASEFQFPKGIHVVDGMMFVADSTNNRVLIWYAIPTSSGLRPADLVLGQPDFTSNARRPVTASSLYEPSDVHYDSRTGRLVVADSNNNRVLIWNSLPTTNGAPADVVVGQNAFNVNLANAGATTNEYGLAQPTAAIIAHDVLFVADFANQRVMVWQPVPTTNGQPATAVLGRGSFGDTGNPTPSEFTVGFAQGVCAIDHWLYVVGSNWNRATRFRLNL